MAPKAKAKSSAGQPKGSKRKETCAAIIAEVFPDFADDASFCAELAGQVIGIIKDVKSADQLRNALEDALAGKEDAEVIALLSDVYGRLQAAGLATPAAEEAAEAVQTTADKVAALPVLSLKRFDGIFSKELRNRERAAGNHTVTSEALACLHDWDNTGAGGVHCQVCNFETKDNHYCCKFDCGVQLCGKCWWKWKEKA